MEKRLKKIARKLKSEGPAYISRILFSLAARGCKGIGTFLLDRWSFIYARVFKKPLIYVIGDSHTVSFTRTPLFIVKPLGPATAYKLPCKNSSTKSNQKLFKVLRRLNPKKDLVLTVFGEIDCRIHIYNQFLEKDKQVPLSVLVQQTIANYSRVLQAIGQLGFNVIVYGIPPANTQPNIYNYPHYADSRTQRDIKKEFNRQLKAFCEENNYKYLEIFSRFSNPEGFILAEYARDDIHLNHRVMGYIKDWFRCELGYRL